MNGLAIDVEKAQALFNATMKKLQAVEAAGVEIPNHVRCLFQGTLDAIKGGVSVRTAALLASACCEVIGELPIEWRRAADAAVAAAATEIPDGVPADWD